jgi:hypothetical protein
MSRMNRLSRLSRMSRLSRGGSVTGASDPGDAVRTELAE